MIQQAGLPGVGTMRIAITRELDEETLQDTAALHCKLLPGSVISRFGRAFARSFYRYAASSQTEMVFAARDLDTTIAAAILSLQPHDLQRRLLIHTSLALHMAAHPFAAISAFQDWLFPRLTGDIDPKLPEIIAIFTAPSHQNLGVGGQLLQIIERELTARGVPHYGLRTADSSGNRAVKFYEKHGFVLAGHAHSSHGRFRVMTRRIAGTDVRKG